MADKEQPPRKIIEIFNWAHTYKKQDCLFVKLLREGGLDDEEIAVVVTAMRDVCDSCFDQYEPCNCSNDE